jgi:hypothetical protein
MFEEVLGELAIVRQRERDELSETGKRGEPQESKRRNARAGQDEGASENSAMMQASLRRVQRSL